MTSLTRLGRPSRKADIWLRRSDTENVVFDPETESVHLLNPTAMAIWVLCDGETEVGEMVEAICELTGLPRDVVVDDVDRILGEFEAARILDWVS